MSKTKKKILVAVTVLCMTVTICWSVLAMNIEGNTRQIDGPVQFTLPEKGEWIFRENHWYFCMTGGEAKNRWVLIENKNGSRDWFCFDSRGAMCTGWQRSGNGNWYYLRETADERQGAMERGFILDAANGRCYYTDPGTGIMRTGWVSVDGNSYYFAETGEGTAWAWDRENSKWIETGAGRPYGSMYRNEQTPDGAAVDELGRKL